MPNTIVVAGYGPGISHAVAERFGRAGFSVALLARNASKLEKAVKELEGKGIKAAAFAVDAGDGAKVRAAIQKARSTLGPIGVVHWNAAAQVAGDILTSSIDELRAAFDVGVAGLVGAVQESLGDLRETKNGAVLVTNGGFGLFDSNVDAYAVQTQNMGLAIGNAAKHKATRLLSKRLEKEGVYVGEVMVLATVKGTPWDQGQATLNASDVADRFWQLFEGRKEAFVQLGGPR